MTHDYEIFSTTNHITDELLVAIMDRTTGKVLNLRESDVSNFKSIMYQPNNTIDKALVTLGYTVDDWKVNV